MTEREIVELLAPIFAPYLAPCEPATGTRHQQALFVASQLARAVEERIVGQQREAREAGDELVRAQDLFPAFHGPHEGYAVILEELDELWQEVKASKPGADRSAMRKEAIQVAAMALRFVHDVCDARLDEVGRLPSFETIASDYSRPGPPVAPPTTSPRNDGAPASRGDIA